MGGVGVPQGAGSSMGFGGGGYANTQQAVMGADNKLEAYNPDTMARTLRADPTPLPAAAGAGMTTQGVPDYVSNWLAQGGKGAMPSGSQEAALGTSAALPTYADPEAGKHFTGAKKIVVPPKTAGGIGTPAGASATTDPNAGMTMIPMNAAGGYNQVGVGGNLPNSGFYNPQLGYDAGPGVPQGPGNPGGKGTVIGGPDGLPQMMGGPIFTNSKGGYFAKDPSGKMVPLTGLALQAAQGVGKSMGYQYQPTPVAPIAKKVTTPTKKVVKK